MISNLGEVGEESFFISAISSFCSAMYSTCAVRSGVCSSASVSQFFSGFSIHFKSLSAYVVFNSCKTINTSTSSIDLLSANTQGLPIDHFTILPLCIPITSSLI
jgi:hypothetical protein